MTTALIAILGSVGAVLFAIIVRQGTDEFKAWTPRLTGWILELAVSKLPENKRDRMREEWAGRIADTPGEVGKWVEVLRHLFASWSISRSTAGGREKELHASVQARASVQIWLTHADADHVIPHSLRDFGIDAVFETNYDRTVIQAKYFDQERIIRFPHHGR